MTIKHSKFKNTGILFELLVRQITSDVLNGKKDSPSTRIMESFFNSSKELGKEFILYRSFFNTKTLTETRSLDFINMVCEQRTKLNDRKLAEQKYELIKAIKEHYDLEQFLSYRVPQYKVYASIYKNLEAASRGITIQNFETLSEAKSTIVEHLTGNPTKPEIRQESELVSMLREKEESLRLLSYRVLLEKFNEKYSGLSSKQKALLKEYINNVSDRGSLVSLVNKESKSVYKSIKESLPHITNKVMRIKLHEVMKQLNVLSRAKQINNSHLTALMIGYEIEKQIQDSFQIDD